MGQIQHEAVGGDLNPRVMTLGTAGGPMWWTGEDAGRRSGIATAVLVGDRAYLVDCGHGVGRQLMLAGISISSIKGIFLTHLHSDHTIDLGSLAIDFPCEANAWHGRPLRIYPAGLRHGPERQDL